MVDEPTDIIQEQMQCVTFMLEDLNKLLSEAEWGKIAEQ